MRCSPTSLHFPLPDRGPKLAIIPSEPYFVAGARPLMIATGLPQEFGSFIVERRERRLQTT
jgi:hypothetical protein